MHAITVIGDFLESALNRLLITLLALLLIVVVVQVGGRLFLHTPPLWTVDISALLLVWSVFTGVAIVFRSDDHFLIDLWPKRRESLYRVIYSVSLVLVILISGVLAYDGILYAHDSRLRVSGMLQIPVIYFVAAIPFGLSLGALFSLERLLRVFKSPGDLRVD